MHFLSQCGPSSNTGVLTWPETLTLLAKKIKFRGRVVVRLLHASSLKQWSAGLESLCASLHKPQHIRWTLLRWAPDNTFLCWHYATSASPGDYDAHRSTRLNGAPARGRGSASKITISEGHLYDHVKIVAMWNMGTCVQTTIGTLFCPADILFFQVW